MPSRASAKGCAIWVGLRARTSLSSTAGPRATDDRLASLAEELVRLKVDVIVAPTSICTGAAKRATSTIPIVFASHADPIGSGHVASLARPGGNATGITIVMSETAGKSLELLKEAVPGLSALPWYGTQPHLPTGRASMRWSARGRALGLQVQAVAVHSATEFASAFPIIVQGHSGGVLVLATPLFIGGAGRLAELAVKHKVPTIFGSREHVEAGGLLSYRP